MPSSTSVTSGDAMVAPSFSIRGGTNEVLRYCHTHGLVLLKAGLYDNVIRLLFPLTASEQELDRGLDILEEALGSVAA